MEPFKAYSLYYDLLYREKDYQSEAKYILQLLSSFELNLESILDFGCGTGKHDVIFANQGLSIHGVDVSESMIRQAKQYESGKLKFEVGDMRKHRLDKKFSAVISLFHVMSYQTENADLINSFKNASYHLEKGGLFIFDCWFGPAVLNDPPTVRIKRLEDTHIKVVRITEPVMVPLKNTVLVNFDIHIEDTHSKSYSTVTETHKMRYLFYPEIAVIAEMTGFQIVKCEKWLGGGEPDINSWYATFVLQKCID